MGAVTKIEWCDKTFNSWIGCTKVSPACDHCYAEAWDKRFGGEHWGPHAERRRTSTANWQEPRRWNRQAEAAGIRPRVFCASLADVFDNQVPSRWRDDLWHLIDQTRSLDWLLLTKRPQNIVKMLPGPAIGAPEWGAGWPNVWLGTTAENQEEADRRVLVLLRVPAAKRFLSAEPLLGPIDLTSLDPDGNFRPYNANGLSAIWRNNGIGRNWLDWVIVGGESGPDARPMHPDWARSLRDQCVKAGVPFCFKQWGEWLPTDAVDQPVYQRESRHLGGPWWAYRLGKKAAGRLLDGREWNEVPA